jgi:hypothetical protein
VCDRWLDLSRQRASRSMLDSLMFTRGHSHKSIKPSHVVRPLWGQWLAIRRRPSLRLALRSVGRAGTRVGKRMPMVRLVTVMERMRSVHNRGWGLVFLQMSSRSLCLDESIAVHNSWVVLAHGGVAWRWHPLATARILGRGTLHDSYRLGHRLTHRSVVPGLSLTLARCSRFLGAARCISRVGLDRLRDMR